MPEIKKTWQDKVWAKTGLSFWIDYPNLFHPSGYNWVNFTFIHFTAEWDKADNTLVWELGLLGFNLRWQIPLPGETEQSLDLKKRFKEIEKQIKKHGVV